MIVLFCHLCKRHVRTPDAKTFRASGHDDTKVARLPRNMGRRQRQPNWIYGRMAAEIEAAQEQARAEKIAKRREKEEAAA